MTITPDDIASLRSLADDGSCCIASDKLLRIADALELVPVLKAWHEAVNTHQKTVVAYELKSSSLGDVIVDRDRALAARDSLHAALATYFGPLQ